jgi:hypothetical protein
VSYHSLSECTLSDDERWQEKNRIVKILDGEDLKPTDRDFVNKMKSASFVSTAQLFFLRDIKDRV